MGELALLYELQQLELKYDKLCRKLKDLPIVEDFKKLQSEVTDVKEAITEAESDLAEQRKQIRSLERQADSLRQEVKQIQAKLYSGAIKNAKELEQLESKSKVLTRERDKIEDDMLTAMEITEELEKRLEDIKGTHREDSHRLRELQQQGNSEIKGLKEELQFCRSEREKLLESINKQLLHTYRDMRLRYQGRPLARVEGEICSGCRVSISSNLKNRLYNPESVISCENCGRILVPLILKNNC